MSKTRLPGMICPHCGNGMHSRTSEAETPLSRLIRYQCTQCMFGCVAQLEIIRQLVPSTTPNAAILLPLCNPNLQHSRRQSENDDTPPPANDEHPPAATESAPMSG